MRTEQKTGIQMGGLDSLHELDASPSRAREIQEELRSLVRVEPLDLGSVSTAAGADLSFSKGSDRVFAGFVVLEIPSLEPVARAGITSIARFPYIPGLLSFREIPALLEAWDTLPIRPDALIYDGHGVAHPRRFGIAAHLGVLLNLPTAGCAKSILVGTHEPVGNEPGDWKPLVHRGEVIGAALRSRGGVSPVYVSVGNRIDLESAIGLVQLCLGPTRLPETTRQAHRFVNELRLASAD
jgi:deoxyribonuclease V